MPLTKTSTLTSAALDWAVAIAEGVPNIEYSVDGHAHWWCFHHDSDEGGYVDYRPTIDWTIAGPIIERERIALNPSGIVGGGWNGSTEWGDQDGFDGDTALIAAMRAHVASKLGAEVDIPASLL